MGDISVFARRLENGQVQYGWCGNGGYYKSVGAKLLEWYSEPSKVEYLFSLGQTRNIGKPGSEHGGASIMLTHEPTGERCWLGSTEREIFSRIAFVDYGYFYDTDDQWYYIHPGPFRIKFPLDLIANNLDDRGYEFDFVRSTDREILRYILTEYGNNDSQFDEVLNKFEGGSESILESLKSSDGGSYDLFSLYKPIFNYFDDWIVVKPDEDHERAAGFIVKKETDIHIETIMWQ